MTSRRREYATQVFIGVGMGEEFEFVAEEFKEFNHQMRDPLVVGAMLHKLTEERQSTNLLFKNLVEKIESLEAKVTLLESRISAPPRVEPQTTSLSQTDEKIIDFVKTRGKASAQEVQREFGYKGRNAASSRLNSLFKQQLLQKSYAGKTVFFKAK